ncbi:acyltransferase [Citreicella sp. C3M06]|uniref:acyltransferase family protein n=1 Tax=Citreicella sp. C3M06 TaxID=2841564 RepID=UPI001C0A265F|nr:acyltransferase family protein [Citreicella sp. C3M06]MBU2960794.1 acyltransferase [Citreicella sp. C3M06]
MRSDIQGLRALAVVLVVLDHVFGFPAGGFVGVDVFFVISGYLITAHLLREIEATGTVSILGFYAKRVRRILPVALLVAAVTVLAAFVLWFPPRAVQVLLDGLSAIGFVANIHFMALGTDYLSHDAAVSPFQHYWSLSIEEQFYALWPILLLGVMLLPGGRGLRIGLVALLAAVSLGWGLYRSIGAPAMAYFDTGVRAWELLAGALLAMAGPWRLGPRLRRWGGHCGLGLILGSAILLSASWVIPVPAVLPAVIGAVLVLGADAPAGPRSVPGNPLSRWLGDVSYSLYLWHFPVLVLAQAQFGTGLIVALATLPLMLGLSWLSYRYVERAVLDSRFLRPGQGRWTRPAELALGVAVLGVIAGLSIVQLQGHAAVRSAGPWMKLLDRPVDFATVDKAMSQEERQQDIGDALAAQRWPGGITPQLSQLSDADFADAMFACRQNPLWKAPRRVCRYTHGDTPVAVIGDSIAASWVPAISAIGQDRGWDVAALAYSNCSLFDTDVTDAHGTPGFREACKQRRAEMFAFLDALKPSIVFLSASESALTFTGHELDTAAELWKLGAERTFSRLAEVEQLVVLQDPPWGASPADCATRFSPPESCVVPVSARHKAKAEAESAVADTFDNVTYVPTRDWFCAQGKCPLFASRQLTRVDRMHLTAATAYALSDLIAEGLDHDP